jgi:FkbM family methyltransferase
MIKAAGPFISWLVRVLPPLQSYARGPILRRLYWSLYGVWEREGPPARATLYGSEVLINRGNLVPFFIYNAPLFNAPLVQLVHSTALAKKAPVIFVDIGAAFGDTVLLITNRCPGEAGSFICIEGDAQFYELLVENMKALLNVTVVKTLLARAPMKVRSLVKHHKGTATCTGSDLVDAVDLDSIPPINQAHVDVMKIDVDGFDGEVLAGALKTLARCHPAVLFEWDPRRIVEAGNEPFSAFEALEASGYNRFLWFNNNGTFSHFSGPCSRVVLKKQFEYLLAVNHRAHEHFDIIALHEGSKLNEIDLAAMEFAWR